LALPQFSDGLRILVREAVEEGTVQRALRRRYLVKAFRYYHVIGRKTRGETGLPAKLLNVAGDRPQIFREGAITDRIQALSKQFIRIDTAGKETGHHRGEEHPSLFVLDQEINRL
jgi:hypothetical protein